MMRVAVTGGAGFIGSNLTKRLVNDGVDVVVIDDLSTGLLENLNNVDIDFQNVSLLNRNGLSQIFANVDFIFHLGARGSVPRSIQDPQATHEVNATGTLNVLEAARKRSIPIVFSSSSSVYGRNSKLPKSEDMWTSPLSPYAASKLSGEGYVQSYAYSYNLSATIFRFFNVFGPLQRPNHDYAAVIPKWIYKALRNEPIQIYGDGTQTRDFTFVDTVVEVLVNCLESELNYKTPINLAFGNKISLNQVTEMILRSFPDLKVEYREKRHGDVHDSQNSPELLRKLFPTIIPIDFEKGLEQTIKWMRSSIE